MTETYVGGRDYIVRQEASDWGIPWGLSRSLLRAAPSMIECHLIYHQVKDQGFNMRTLGEALIAKPQASCSVIYIGFSNPELPFSWNENKFFLTILLWEKKIDQKKKLVKIIIVKLQNYYWSTFHRNWPFSHSTVLSLRFIFVLWAWAFMSMHRGLCSMIVPGSHGD